MISNNYRGADAYWQWPVIALALALGLKMLSLMSSISKPISLNQHWNWSPRTDQVSRSSKRPRRSSGHSDLPLLKSVLASLWPPNLVVNRKQSTDNESANLAYPADTIDLGTMTDNSETPVPPDPDSVEAAADERIRREALRQLEALDLDDINARIEPMWALEAGITDDNFDVYESDDGMLDLPPRCVDDVLDEHNEHLDQIATNSTSDSSPDDFPNSEPVIPTSSN